MYLYGAGSQAMIIKEILEACGERVEKFIDDNPELQERDGVPVVKETSGLSPVIVAIGNNAIRRKVAEGLDCAFGTAIHPTAYIAPSASVGEGSVVMPMATVHTHSVIGRHCIVNTNSVIEHETELGDYAHVAPGATVGAYVRVGEGAFIGMGAVVRAGVKIGKDALIGMGAVVVNDIPDGVVAYGCPCRVIKRIES